MKAAPVVTVPASRPRASCDPLSGIWCVRGAGATVYGFSLPDAYDGWRHELRMREFYRRQAAAPVPGRWWHRWPGAWAVLALLVWVVAWGMLAWSS